MDLLEEKLDKEALDSIKNMGDSLTCPLCGLTMTADPWLKEIECPSCEKKSCRFCKKQWNFADHTECSIYSSPNQDKTSSPLDVPLYWSPMPENENKDYITVLLNANTPEFSHVKGLFLKSMKDTNVCSIWRIQNLRLWQKFNLTKKHMEDDFGQDKLNERQLFHGTNYTAVDGICREGLDWRMSGENAGTAFGQGTYFTRSASYSDRYTTPFVPIFYCGSRQDFRPGFFNVVSVLNPLGLPVNSSTQSSSNVGSTLGLQTPAVSTDKAPTLGSQSSAFGSGTTGFGQSSQQSGTTVITTLAKPLYPPASGFTFGDTQNALSEFSFGNPQSASGFSFGNPQSSSGFTFGNTQSSGGFSNPPNPSSGFIFGTQQNSSSSGSSFNDNKNSTDLTQANMKYLFVARVLVGRCCVGSPSIRKPPVDPEDSKKRPFNSCVDDVHNPQIFVIFDSSQSYPEYIIEYGNLPKISTN